MNRVTIVLVTVCLMAVMAHSADQSSDLAPSEGFVDVTGGKVWYRIVGSGERTPLLLVNGGPGVSSIYLKPLEALAADRPVIFYDQLGCGNSSDASDTALWTVEHFVEEISQLREALGLEEVHLYGHSWGTMVAADYVLSQPTGVISLILASPVLSMPRWIDDCDSLLGTLPDSLEEIIRHHERNQTTGAAEYQTSLMVYSGQFFARKQPWSDELNSVFATVNQAMYSYMWGPSEFTITGTLRDYDRTENLGKIAIPTLLTAGQFDYCTPSTVEYYQSLIPGAEFALLTNCAHMTMHDDPETDVRVIREFLAKVESK